MSELEIKELINKAERLYYSGKYFEAIDLCEQILSLYPENENATTLLIKSKMTLIRRGDHTFIPEAAAIAFGKAQSAYRIGDFESAVELLQQAIEIATKEDLPFPGAESLLKEVIDQLERSKKRKIFISYARDDFIIAKDIYSFLRDNGFIPWMDKFDLLPGQNWELEIKRNIKVSDFFIACLSQNSVSKRGYVQKELKQALSVLEQFPEGEIYLIPVRIDDCTVPETLAEKQWLDWSTKDAKYQLLKAIQRR